ncbi:gamma-glutamylcyclotransferase [Halobacteriales archaeon QS_1_68_17]|nr:MAG: gamma-glutamylcyclotransferase [Halobacteriales archaeon QS_1_68_17]
MDVFIYGTLTDPERADRVLDTYEYRGRARLDGLHRVEGEYPTLAPGGSVAGRVLRTPDVAALDRYEGVDRELYVRVSVPRADRDGSVAVYVGDPGALGADATWPGTGSFADQVERYVADRAVTVAGT